jgi:hypothetical protein
MKETTLGILDIVLLNDAVSISDCIASNDWMVVMDELESGCGLF